MYMSNRTTTMNFPTTPPQQGLIKDYPESQAPNMRYPARAPSPHPQTYSSGYGNFGDALQFHHTTQANHQQNYSTEQLQYHQQQQHMHYNNTYNNRLISDGPPGASNNVSSGPFSSIYSNRARYLPYPHSLPQHSMRGMYTPAGQQLIPSSVLHYPPRSAAYQSNTMSLQQQRSVLPEQYSSAPHTQPPRQPHLRQQQQPSPKSQLLQHQTSFGPNESHMRHYADTLNTTQPTYGQTTPQTLHLMMHLNGNRSPPATLISPPSPAHTQTARSVSRPPPDDGNTHLQLRHQFQQQSLSSPSATQTLSNEELLTGNMPTSLQSAEPSQQLPGLQIQSGSSKSSELSTVSEDAQDSSRDYHEEKHLQTSTSQSAIHNNGLASASRIISPQQTTSSECLTTSPPLISATGTDSGISISSCSTRARSDSTQSTPVYNGEYPMSVGSSSGVSYQCADIKDFEENEISKFNLEIVEGDINMGDPGSAMVVEENSSNAKEQTIDRRFLNDRNLFEATKESDDKTEGSDNTTALLEPTRSPGTQNNIEQSSDTHRTEEFLNELTLNTQEVVPRNTEMKGEHKECTELPLNQQQTHKEQQENVQVGGKTRESIAPSSNNMRTPLPISPRPHLEPSAQELPSPPVPPAPPQNSPVDYCRTSSISNMNAFAYVPLPTTQLKVPTSAAAAAAAAAVAAAAAAAAASIRSNKNRIMECDLIPSRKSKRKSNLIPGKRHEDKESVEVSDMKDNRDMTPLPGFQQAFGSTEIGRFFETFLLSPPDCHSFTDNYEPFDADENWQQVHQHQQQQQQQQQQQHQLQIKPDQQPLELNQLQQHKQQQQQYAQQEYVHRRYADNNIYPSPHQRLYPQYPHSTLHPSHPYHRGQSYPFHISANSNHRDMRMYGRNALNPYAMPSEYGAARSGSSSPSSPYQMPLNLRSGYGSAYDGRYSYGRINGSYSGIRCNGY
ncbi:ecdysone-induced protein 74EF [Zeugodacus cucurbitae]|uniref:ecdysone-induced protein 74EF n=1 Tax=Zeugodacus cucurbitae TaxID=28588 RepID=UPI000596A425|nr:ecdysone-induced protein 74EF [Zeugodacus cucurbitae]XP_028895626.1 ecdysone-induced protein 74EF [Zeugodacus cucurbitae]XP_054085345.1 ecdysone-induced protein 74EF [Zeugodacus cucurbitae]